MTATAQKELTHEQRKEADEARHRVKQADRKIDALLAQQSRWIERYDELERQLEDWQQELDAKLEKLREAYLEGEASFDDLAEHFQDRRLCEDMAADLRRRKVDRPVYQHLIDSRSARMQSAKNGTESARRTLRRYGIEP